MKFHDKLQILRKNKGMSQEMLAEMFDVSRQAVSRWESGQVYPETEKIVVMSEFFGVSLDELVKDGELNQPEPSNNHNEAFEFVVRPRKYEYVSQKTLFGRPLVHVSIGWGAKRARGIIAIGNVANGLLSFGIVSTGIISFGLLSIGIVSIATFAFGLLLAVGAIAVGAFAIGAIALGFFALGAVAIGVHVRGAVEVLLGG